MPESDERGAREALAAVHRYIVASSNNPGKDTSAEAVAAMQYAHTIANALRRIEEADYWLNKFLATRGARLAAEGVVRDLEYRLAQLGG